MYQMQGWRRSLEHILLIGSAYDQLTKKAGKLEKELKKGNIFTKKVEHGKYHGQYIAPDAWIISRIYI